ncbi:MAG TPA: NUDIX hydrolase [Terriglobia bacterium]|nr:NUDIX hydrolase [Terriglobia bacterium]
MTSATDTSSRSSLRLVSTKTVYRGKMIDVRVDRIVEPRGIPVQREVVCHGGSAVVLPYFREGRILLVRQFRYPARQALWELVAGGVEPGESPKQAAERELREETGYTAKSFKLLFKFYPSPGVLSEKMHLFEAVDLTRGTAEPEEDERIQVKLFSMPKLKEMVGRGKIQDGKTLVGLLWLLGRRS